MSTLYEAVFVIKSSVPHDALKGALQNIQDLIPKEGGKIVKVFEWGKRKLAYPIQKHEEAFYLVLYFELDPLKIARILSVYKLNDQILRSLILKVDGKHVKMRDETKPQPAKERYEAEESVNA